MALSPQPLLPPIQTPPPIDIPALGTSQHSPETAKAPSARPPRAPHSTVLSRLQALFPSSPHTQPTPAQHPPSPPPPPVPPKPQPKFIKVRILTWNMHDSLPKGDVEELLGSIPPLDTSLPHSADDPPTLPVFPPTPEHPYHIVIVAGQECPSASGIPMALGAGFKLNNKDNSRSRHSLLPQDADESMHRKSAEADVLSPTLDKSHDHTHPPSSWSSILENWYCHHPTLAQLGPSASDPNIKTQHEAQRLAPYELLIKERMMGLYLAVFIHRDARPFVRGTSKSAVTTGLIGGRVGNKGGVGVSVNLDGTTLLFINAHLAAHEGKVHHRLADLAKIKAELSVDDFLSPDDPRFMAEDITDRFDTTFIFGDLNFRLDITRLHADWLIARQDYEQALEFDQLRNVMARGDAFAGFSEAQIRFPPTFKYDVLRTIKRSRTKSFKRAPITPTTPAPHEKLLSEVAENEKEHIVNEDQISQQEQAEEDVDPDGASVVSTAWTSVRSKHVVDPDADRDNEGDADREPHSAPYFLQSTPASASTTHLMHKMWSAAAAHKAKEKWMTIVNANGLKSPTSNAKDGKKKWRQSWGAKKAARSPGPSRRASQPAGEDLPPQTPVDPADPRQPKAGRARELQAALLDAVHARPHRHLALSVNNVDLEEDKGVYDSSHKQRVPSWCDRILWKSTIVPEPDSDVEDAELQRFVPLRTKMGQIFHALRPSSLRSRRDSTWSVHHPDLSQGPQTGDSTAQAVPRIEKRLPPVPQASSPTRGPRLSQTRSVDSFRRSSSSDERTLARIHSFEPSSSSLSPSGRGVPLRHANTISTVTPVGDASSTTLVSSLAQPSSPLDVVGPGHASPSPSAPMFRWLRPFFNRDVAQQHTVVSPEESRASLLPAPAPRRGDVVCLKYDTLDDRGMRRLEGRSDHRPVVGSYALYI